MDALKTASHNLLSQLQAAETLAGCRWSVAGHSPSPKDPLYQYTDVIILLTSDGRPEHSEPLEHDTKRYR